MSRPASAVSYRAVLGSPGAPRAFAAATLGRLSFATVSLSLLFTAQSATGSFAVAGAVLAVFGLTALLAPIKARLVDRYGQQLMLSLLGTGYAAALTGVAAAASAGVHHPAVFVLLALLAGALTPPLGPCMRALWASLTDTDAARQRAYSLDAVVEDILFTAGPVMAGALIAAGGPSLALIATAALALVGSLALATSPAAAVHAGPATTRTPGPLLGPLRTAGFLGVLCAVLGIGMSLGAMEVAVAARADSEGAPGTAGYLLAAVSLGSVVGGLVWGGRTVRRSTSTQLMLLLTALAVGITAAAAAPTLPVLGVILALTGAAVAPAFVVSYLAADRLVSRAGRTEATTWVNTSNNIGVALGSAAAGLLVDQFTPAAPLIAGTAVLGVTVVALFASRTGVDRVAPTSTSQLNVGPS